MVDMLDAMQQLMTGDLEYFDPAFLSELGNCWDLTHPDLRQAEDNAWQGMIDFFENDGWNPYDPWGIDGTSDQWHEDNATAQDFHGILVLEPCNYASNIAFCHASTELCHTRANLSMSQGGFHTYCTYRYIRVIRHPPNSDSLLTVRNISYLSANVRYL